ncbi:hypothetical protein [Desulfosarcina sp.]|uniref:hypothetical protein n=1 Tax=Desulfosarcina sp. TaxID=2027861 RepID=UPI0035659D5A
MTQYAFAWRRPGNQFRPEALNSPNGVQVNRAWQRTRVNITDRNPLIQLCAGCGLKKAMANRHRIDRLINARKTKMPISVRFLYLLYRQMAGFGKGMLMSER